MDGRTDASMHPSNHRTNQPTNHPTQPFSNINAQYARFLDKLEIVLNSGIIVHFMVRIYQIFFSFIQQTLTQYFQTVLTTSVYQQTQVYRLQWLTGQSQRQKILKESQQMLL